MKIAIAIVSSSRPRIKTSRERPNVVACGAFRLEFASFSVKKQAA
jgi:hypothetical protein